MRKGLALAVVALVSVSSGIAFAHAISKSTAGRDARENLAEERKAVAEVARQDARSFRVTGCSRSGDHVWKCRYAIVFTRPRDSKRLTCRNTMVLTYRPSGKRLAKSAWPRNPTCKQS